MLILSRKQGERITIGDDITIVIVSIPGDKVRLGIDAPKELAIKRPDMVKREPAEAVTS